MNLNLYNNKNFGADRTGLITTKELARRWGKTTLTILRYRQKGLIKSVNKQSPFGKTGTYYFDLNHIKELEKTKHKK